MGHPCLLSWVLAVARTRMPGKQDDAEVTRQVIGQMDSPAAGKGHGQRGKRVT
jgi:hypothetical protein